MGLPPQLRSLLVSIYKNIEYGKCQCGGFVDIKRAWIPRIMVGARKGVTSVRLIVVGKNPGHPIPEEADRYCMAILTGPKIKFCCKDGCYELLMRSVLLVAFREFLYLAGRILTNMMDRYFMVAVCIACALIGLAGGYYLELYLRNNLVALVGAAIVLAILTWVGSGTDILGLLRDMYKDKKEEKRKPTLALDNIFVIKRELEIGKKYNEDTYSIRVSIIKGEGIVDDCHVFLDIKGTKIRHYPTVWIDSELRHMPISEFEYVKLFTVSDYKDDKELKFWSRSLNPMLDVPRLSEIVPYKDMIDRDMTIVVRARNANLPGPLTIPIKQIIDTAEEQHVS